MVVIWINWYKQISTKAIMKTRMMNRGTKLLYRESCPPNSTGLLYQKCQENSMVSLPPGTIISTKRGTSRMKVADYPKVDNTVPNWGFITTARGTAVRGKNLN